MSNCSHLCSEIVISAAKFGGVVGDGGRAFDVSEELMMYLIRAFSDFLNVFPEVV